MTNIGTRVMGILARLRRKSAGLMGDRRGVAAVEFALIAPLLLTLYFVTMEVAQGIEGNKRVSRVASMVADLVTQQPTVTKNDLEAIMQIGNAIVYPYNRSIPVIEVTGIQIEDKENPKAFVEWSRRMTNNTFSSGTPKKNEVTIPEKLLIRGTFLVRVSTGLEYRPVIAWAAEEKAGMGLVGAFDKIPMEETYYLRPRMSNAIACTGC